MRRQADLIFILPPPPPSPVQACSCIPLTIVLLHLTSGLPLLWYYVVQVSRRAGCFCPDAATHTNWLCVAFASTTAVHAPPRILHRLVAQTLLIPQQAPLPLPLPARSSCRPSARSLYHYPSSPTVCRRVTALPALVSSWPASGALQGGAPGLLYARARGMSCAAVAPRGAPCRRCGVCSPT